jgi:MerR family transcriptional regulator, copper efflux regulator
MAASFTNTQTMTVPSANLEPEATVVGPAREMQIGELGRLSGVAAHVLRHWEAVGVLTPAVRVHGRRVYRELHVRRVGLIISAQEAGLSLHELREVLEAPTIRARREMLEQHASRLMARVLQLEKARGIVEQMLAWPHEDLSECPLAARALCERGSPATGGRLREVPSGWRCG